MIEIGRTIVSFDLLDQYFLCDLVQCKGACCIEGQSGAPLSGNEASIIKAEFPHFEKYLPHHHVEEIKNQGFAVVDIEGDTVTPLVNKQQCVYSYFDEAGILKCAIEKAYNEGETTFRKPVSCHLFPVRITHYKRFEAVNYQQIEICKPGRNCGKANKLPLYQFLKQPLIRNYGDEWYQQLEIAAAHIDEIR